MKIISFISLAILMSSCATMTPNECKNADWKSIGYKDGAKGRAVRLSRHANACAKTHITPDKKRYILGYKQGEKMFCTYDNGLGKGSTNGDISDICMTPSLKKDFQRGYRKGKRIYAKKEQIQTKEREISSINKKIEKIKKGKGGGVKDMDLLYREKGLIEKEMSLLQSELNNIK